MSVRFNAVADRVSRTTNLPASNNLTFICFAKLLSTTNNFNCFFSLDDGSNYSLIETLNDASHTMFCGDGPANDMTGGAMTVGDWYAIGYSSNGTTLRMWMKNLTAGTPTVEYTTGARATNPVGGGWTLYVGGNGFGEITSCDIRSPMIWRTAYNQTQFDAQVASLSPVDPTNIDSWFTLATNSLTDMTDDQSVNGRDLTRGASTWETDGEPPVGGGGTITGTSSVTLANDTQSASGAHGVAGASSVTLAADAHAAAGAQGVTGSSSATSAPDVSAAAGAHGVAGTSSVTLANDTSSGVGGVVVTGTSAVTLADDVGAGAGAVAVIGSSSVTLAPDVHAAAGTFGDMVLPESQALGRGSSAVVEQGGVSRAVVESSSQAEVYPYAG